MLQQLMASWINTVIVIPFLIYANVNGLDFRWKVCCWDDQVAQSSVVEFFHGKRKTLDPGQATIFNLLYKWHWDFHMRENKTGDLLW